jgi:hypothetical protein
MTQRHLDLCRKANEPNVIPLGPRHVVEVRNKGTALGIYTLSAFTNKKRGVSLPLEDWITLQQKLPLINLNLQFASGTVGIDLLDSTAPPHGYAPANVYAIKNVLTDTYAHSQASHFDAEYFTERLGYPFIQRQ